MRSWKLDKFLGVENLETYRPLKTLHEVNPQVIKYTSKSEFSIDSQEEKISDGDWDLELSLFDNTNAAYKAYIDVFLKGLNWNDTEFYKGKLQAGLIRVKDNSKLPQKDKDLWKILRCRYLNYLYKAMRELGYAQDPYANFMSITIGRNGEIILNNGRHRLAAAKILKIPIVPILIDVRHKKWVDFRQSILDYASRHGGKVYAPLNHLDLWDIPPRQSGRITDVLSAISKDTKTIVDLGANWGYMCQWLEVHGYKCVAVENDIKEFWFLSKLKDIGN